MLAVRSIHNPGDCILIPVLSWPTGSLFSLPAALIRQTELLQRAVNALSIT